MSAVEFPYAVHKGLTLPIIPIGIGDHRLYFNDRDRKVTFHKL